MIDVNAPISRLQTGSKWSEGSAWNATKRYLVWSDVPNRRQWQWRESDGKIRVFRDPGGQAKGCTLDAADRMICCERVGH